MTEPKTSVITDLTALVERIVPGCKCENNGDYCTACEAVLTTNGLEPLDEYLRRTR